MPKEEAYAFVESKYIDADDAKNVHIFEGYYDEQKRSFSRTSNSCCGKCSTKEKWSCYRIACGTTLEERRKNARQIAKTLEDEGKTVCGQCVSIFYGDNI